MFTAFKKYSAHRLDEVPLVAGRCNRPGVAFLLLAALVVPGVGCTNPSIANSGDGPSIASPFVRQTGQPPTQWVILPMPKPKVAPFGIAAGPHKDIWVTENAGNYVDRIDPATNRFKRYPVPTPNAVLGPIALGPDGNLWFGETAVSKMGRITPTGVITEFPLPGGSDPLDIVTGSDGNLWFSNGHSAVAKMTTAGVVTEYALPSCSSPGTLTMGPDHNIWFTEDNGPRVGKVTPAGAITEYSTGNSSPTSGIAVGADGALWFGEEFLPRLGRVTTDGVVTSVYLRGASAPEGVLNVGASNVLYVFIHQGLATYNIKTHGFEILGFPPENSPMGPFTLGADGNVWFTQSNTNANDVGVYVLRILSVSPASLQLAVGQKATLTASEIENKAPLQAVTSNPAVATVAPAGSNTFTVTGVGSGSCTITVMDNRKNTFPVPVTVH